MDSNLGKNIQNKGRTLSTLILTRTCHSAIALLFFFAPCLALKAKGLLFFFIGIMDINFNAEQIYCIFILCQNTFSVKKYSFYYRNKKIYFTFANNIIKIRAI